MDKPVTATSVAEAKGRRKLSMITACDYPTGLMADESGVDMVLVGDSLAMVVLGHEDTLSVTMDEMLHHCRAVSRGVKRALVIGDMPFMSFQAGIENAVANAGRFLKEGGTRAVKVEGGADFADTVAAISRAGIPVVGHIGLTPQRIAQLGGFRIQGKTAEAARILLDDARAMAKAGCFALVLECVPAEVGAMIAKAVDVPVIGIGAGPDTDGQVLVMHDVLGLFDKFRPKFAKAYAELRVQAVDALKSYAAEVSAGTFPGPNQTTFMNKEELAKLED